MEETLFTFSLPALDPGTVPKKTGSGYPTERLRRLVAGRSKQALGDALGLKNFGVNLVRLEPDGCSALRHWHTRQDEFVFVLEGELTLVSDAGEQVLGPGMCAGFVAGCPDAHQLINKGDAAVVYLEVGDRMPGDQAHYPDVDLKAEGGPATYKFLHKDGSPY